MFRTLKNIENQQVKQYSRNKLLFRFCAKIFLNMVFFWIAVALIAVVGLYRHNNRLQAQRDALAEQQTYEHLSCPILVMSNNPNDPTVFMRAEAERQKLRAAGNKYSETLPIIVYPFALGANGEGGINTWRTYMFNAFQKWLKAVEEWDARVERENAALHQQFILNQSSN